MISSHTKLIAVAKRRTKTSVAFATTAFMGAAEFAAAAESMAPGALGASTNWTTGLKQGLGTAITHARAQQDPVEQILSQMSLDKKFNYITGYGVDFTFTNLKGVFNVRPIERLGLPLIYGADGRIGFVGQGFPPGARFPAGPLVAATWNPDLARRVL